MTGSESLSAPASTSSSPRLSPLARIRRLRKRDKVLLPSQSLFLSSLPPDLIALICSFLLPSLKLTVWPQLSHAYAALLTPACFQRDHVHFSSFILSRLQSANSTASALLSQLRSLTVMIHSPPHNNSILTLPFCQQLQPPFPSRSLAFLSFMVDSAELCRAFLTLLPSLSGLRSLHLDVGGSRTPFPQLRFKAFPQLRAVKLRLLLSPPQLLSLLALPRLQSLDLTHCDMDDANAFVATVESDAAAVAALRRLSSLCLPQDGARVKDIMRMLKGASVERLRMDGDVATVTREELCGLPRLQRFELHHWVRREEEAVEEREDDEDRSGEEERRVMLPPLDVFPRATTTSCLLRRGHSAAGSVSTSSPSFSSLRDDGDEYSVFGSRSSSSSSFFFFTPSVVDVLLQPASNISEGLEMMLRLPALQKLRLRLPVEAALLSPANQVPVPPLPFSVTHALHTLCLDCLFELEDRDVIAVAASAPSLLDVLLRRCHGVTLASVVALGARSRRLKRLRVRSCNGLMRLQWEAALLLVPAASSRLQLFPSLQFLQLEMDEPGARLDASCLSSLLLRLQSSPLQYLTLIHPELTAYQVVQLSCLTRLRALRLTPPSLSRPDTLLHIARSMYQYSGPTSSEDASSECAGEAEAAQPVVVVRRGRGSGRRRRPSAERFAYCEDSGLSGRHELLEDRAALEKERLNEEAEGEEAMRMESRRNGEMLYARTFRTDVVRYGLAGRAAYFRDLAAALHQRNHDASACVLV